MAGDDSRSNLSLIIQTVCSRYKYSPYTVYVKQLQIAFTLVMKSLQVNRIEVARSNAGDGEKIFFYVWYGIINYAISWVYACVCKLVRGRRCTNPIYAVLYTARSKYFFVSYFLLHRSFFRSDPVWMNSRTFLRQVLYFRVNRVVHLTSD